MNHLTLEETIKKITGPCEAAQEASCRRWDSIAKPLGSLGLLEENVTRIAALTGDPSYQIGRRAVVVMCADNGVVAQGVTQSSSDVTALVACNLTKGETCVCRMAKMAGCDVIPVDIGILKEVEAPGLYRRRIRSGTADMTLGPAMTREECVEALETGIHLVFDLQEQGYQLLATGEMGIGNTTTSSAVAAVLTHMPVEQVTGRGAGLTGEGLQRKIRAIEKAIEINRPREEDAIDVLQKVGGLDIAGLAGVFLGGAAAKMPIVIDGLISAVAALCAVKICPAAASAMIASHVSAEPAGAAVLKELGLSPMITAKMCLGEGTGAMAILPLLDMAYDIYNHMSTFHDINMENYEHLK